MTKLREQLLKTLQDLKIGEFKNFKWLLEEDEIVEGLSGIPVSQLEQADRMDTVALMIQKYQAHGALEVTLELLKKISRNDLVQCLEKSTGRHMVEGSNNHNCDKLKAELQTKMKLMIEERQMKIGDITRSAELSRTSADRHIADCTRVFNDLLQSVRTSLADLIHTIHEKRKAAQMQAEESTRELQKEISELENKSHELEQFPHTQHQLSFLTSFTATLDSAPSTSSHAAVAVPSYGRSVATAVNLLQEKLSAEKQKLMAKAKLNRVQESAKDVTLDADTANPFLVLSQDGKQVHCGLVKQDIPDSPKRFDTAPNVLGKQSLSAGRFYYEVQVKGKTSWDLGVVKESIVRGGSIRARPEDGYWTMCLREGNTYQASAASLRPTRQPEKVGVFVDYEKGSVSFYDVGSAELLHCYKDCSFSERLYPFFSPGRHHDGGNSSPLVICPVSYTDHI